MPTPPLAMRAMASTFMAIAASLTSLGCTQPECAEPRYTRAECRVVAEHSLARLRTADDVELRFHDPSVTTPERWAARGVFRVEPTTVLGSKVTARIASPGAFAISLTSSALASQVTLELTNVPREALVRLEAPDGTTSAVESASPTGLNRQTEVTLGPHETFWIRGELPCPDRYRIAAVGDVQTNPPAFERIVEQLSREALEAKATGEPLVALLLLGDLTELSQDPEFELMSRLLERVPFAVATVPGNHDVYAADRALYNRRFGPGTYAFDVCRTHVAALDTGNGALADSVEARLPRLLDPGSADFSLVATHYPPYAALTGNGWAREDQALHLLGEAAFQGTDLLLAGHVHALHDYEPVHVAGASLRQIIAGTGGANQGLGVARYGYVRMTFGSTLDTCFVEVAPPGAHGNNPPVSKGLPTCETP